MEWTFPEYELVGEDFATCPFCGKRDRLEISNKETFDRDLETDRIADIVLYCTRCGLRIYSSDMVKIRSNKQPTYESVREKLRRKWNTRKYEICNTEDQQRVLGSTKGGEQ